MGYESLAKGELATLVTFLEMRERPSVPTNSSPLSLRRIYQPRLEVYRALFRLIGTPWLWFSRLSMDDADLAAIIHDPAVEIYAVTGENGHECGMLELDFRESRQCELAFVGLILELAGKGHGRWLLEEAISYAWRDNVDRVHVHTCSFDHPAALPAYRRTGFLPFRRAIERFPDPRITGILPRDCAPQVPLIDFTEERPES